MSIVYGFRSRNGGAIVTKAYTAGGTIYAGDPVKFSNDTVVVAAADDVVALGWANEGATSGDAVHVVHGGDNTICEMQWTGTLPSNPLQGLYALAGSAGAFQVDVGDTDHDLFKLLAVTRNGATTGHAAGDLRCEVIIPSAMCQAYIGA